MLGCTVVPATEGGNSLKEAVDSACELMLLFVVRHKSGFHSGTTRVGTRLGEAKLLVNMVLSLELAKMVSFLGHLRMTRGLLNKQEQTGLVRLWSIMK